MQGSQARVDIGRRRGRMSGDDQRLAQARVVVGKPFLEPDPVLGLGDRQDGHQPGGEELPHTLGGGIGVGHGAIGVQPEQREGPCARRCEVLHRRQCFGEQAGGPAPTGLVRIAARAYAQGPECPPVAVLRAAIFQPAAIEAHEVAKPPGIRVPGVLHERREPGRQGLGQVLLAGTVERTGQQQRPGIVVDAIAVNAIGHGMDRMLEQPGIVAHRQEIVGPHFGGAWNAARGHALVESRDHPEPMPVPCMFERRQVALSGPLPGHRPAGRIGARAHRLPSRVVGQQSRDLAADGGGVGKRHQNAAPVGEQFDCVPVGRRDDRLSEGKAVGERARGHLRLVQIGRDVDVAHRDEFQQRRLIDELIEEHHVIRDADIARARHQALAVSLALLPNQIGVRRAQHNIDRIGAALQDRRHGVDHEFDALAGREEPERQNDGPVAETQPGLDLLGLDEWKVGSAVRDDLDFFHRRPVHGAQQLATLLRHDDDPRRHLDDAIHDIALHRRRLGQNGVQRRDDRHGQPRQQRHDVAARFAAENAEFMLQADDFELAGIEEVGRAHVVFDLVIVDVEPNDGSDSRSHGRDRSSPRSMFPAAPARLRPPAADGW